MPTIEPRNAQFAERIRESFARQPFVNYLGAELVHIAAGEIDIALPFKAELAQQHGYVHGGVITSIADAAAGYAAMTLVAADVAVLTADLKVNFLRPGQPGRLIAKGRVIKPGRTLSIVHADVLSESSGRCVHILTGLVTMMSVDGMEEKAGRSFQRPLGDVK